MIREWIEFEIKARKSIIHNIEILDYEYPVLHLKAKVSAWTYVRSIAFDLGEILWTWAYVSFLRRISVANISIDECKGIDDICEEDDKTMKLFAWHKVIDICEEDILELNMWRKICDKNNLLINNEKSFIIKENMITHIVEKRDDFIYPVKKI